jgi:hypothetical protein
VGVPTDEVTVARSVYGLDVEAVVVVVVIPTTWKHSLVVVPVDEELKKAVVPGVYTAAQQ